MTTGTRSCHATKKKKNSHLLTLLSDKPVNKWKENKNKQMSVFFKDFDLRKHIT